MNKALLVLVFFVGIRSAAVAGTVILTPARDNTLYEDGAGSLSNGSGIYLFTGKTAALSLRRGLIAFDFSSIPANATITGATLSMYLSKTHGGSAAISLSKGLRDWGEGASDAGEPGGAGIQAEPGDATWFHTFYDTSFWTTLGGDFSSTPSATTTVSTVNITYTWLSGCRLTAADVDLNTSVNTVDVIAVQRFFLGLSTGVAQTGNYQFTPANRSYPGIVSDQTGQDYDTLIYGDVASGYVH